MYRLELIIEDDEGKQKNYAIQYPTKPGTSKEEMQASILEASGKEILNTLELTLEKAVEGSLNKILIKNGLILVFKKYEDMLDRLKNERVNEFTKEFNEGLERINEKTE